MIRPMGVGCLALAASLAAANPALAQDAPQPPQRGNFLFQPGLRPMAPNRAPQAAVPAAPAQAAAQAPAAAPEAAQMQPSPYTGYFVPARPVSWGVRYAVTNGYPPSLFGQFVGADPQDPVQIAPPQPGAPAAPMYSNPPAPGYAAPAPYPPAGLSSIYGYAGRGYGPYYGYGAMYYGYGGTGSYGSAYNSAYYNSGCYQGNACCRAGRRYLTPFGGMGYGCGSGCYVQIPPPCPMVCDPCATTAAPASGTVLPAPNATPTPVTPQPPGAATPPAPIEKRVVPAPQANLLPRLPELPPDA
jgi:hypothetical protein